eukprot:6213387-Pleurochrysis_carterae.AAC.2
MATRSGTRAATVREQAQARGLSAPTRAAPVIQQSLPSVPSLPECLLYSSASIFCMARQAVIRGHVGRPRLWREQRRRRFFRQGDGQGGVLLLLGATCPPTPRAARERAFTPRTSSDRATSAFRCTLPCPPPIRIIAPNV